MIVHDDGRTISAKNASDDDLRLLGQRLDHEIAALAGRAAHEVAAAQRCPPVPEIEDAPIGSRLHMHAYPDGEITRHLGDPCTPPAPRPKPATEARYPYVGAPVQFLVLEDKGRGTGILTRAALVTAVHANGVVDLVIFNQNGFLFRQNVRFALHENATLCWRWPQ